MVSTSGLSATATVVLDPDVCTGGRVDGWTACGHRATGSVVGGGVRRLVVVDRRHRAGAGEDGSLDGGHLVERRRAAA